jgi:hypothetical protein
VQQLIKNNMKQLLFIIALATTTIKAQWSYEKVDNGLDEPYRIAYCMDNSKKGLLKLEAGDSAVSLYILGSYFCDESILLDMGLIVNGESKKYAFIAYKSSNSKILFFMDNILEERHAEFLKDFKACSSLLVRVNESHCTSEYYKFNMSGSTAALTFMSKFK